MSSSLHAFMAPDGWALKVSWPGSGTKTCKSHTEACTPVQEFGWGQLEPAAPPAGTGSHPAPDTP